jgi:broad specificity phosphatase PhoE
MAEILTAIRHGESEHNRQVVGQRGDPVYQEFVEAYERDWQSETTQRLALMLLDALPDECPDSEVALSDEGVLQSRLLAGSLQARVALPAVVVVSPLKRTADTYSLMVETWPALSRVPVIEDTRVQERSRGLQVQYKNWRVFEVFHPEEKLRKDHQGLYWYRYPGGENLDDVKQRVGQCIDDAHRLQPDGHVMVITHEGPILTARANFEGLPPDEILSLMSDNPPANASVTSYALSTGTPVLQAYNEKPHEHQIS